LFCVSKVRGRSDSGKIDSPLYLTAFRVERTDIDGQGGAGDNHRTRSCEHEGDIGGAVLAEGGDWTDDNVVELIAKGHFRILHA